MRGGFFFAELRAGPRGRRQPRDADGGWCTEPAGWRVIGSVGEARGFYFADPGTAMMLRVGIGRGMGPAGLRVVGAVREARGLLAGEATGGNPGNPGWAARANVPRVGL